MRQFVVLLALALACSASANLISKPGFPEGRIINGYEADPGEASYIVSLQAPSHFCAGSIIKDNIIVTAAHCLTSISTANAVAGAHSRSSKENIQTRKFTKADTVIHEKYGGGVGPYDIGLIKLKKPFDINAVARDGSNPVSLIGLICEDFKGSARGTLYGWGTDNSGSLPDKLQKLDVEIIDFDECLKRLPAGNNLADCNVCTHTPNTADGACNGDSGGPLVQIINGINKLLALVSWGYVPCPTTKFPSVYTAISAFCQWISENID